MTGMCPFKPKMPHRVGRSLMHYTTMKTITRSSRCSGART